MSLRIYLIRHARPDVPEGMCYGRTDVPTRSLEEQQLYEHVMQNVTPDLPAFSSPLTRCRQLAMRLRAERFFTVLDVVPQLQEINFGDWEGQRWNDIAREQIDAWASDFLGYQPPGGESVRQARQRVMQAAQYMRKAQLDIGSDCAVIAHAGTIKLMIQYWCGFDDEWLQANRIDYGSITVLEFESDGVADAAPDPFGFDGLEIDQQAPSASDEALQAKASISQWNMR